MDSRLKNTYALRRTSRSRSNQNLKYLIITVLLIGFFATVGIQLLVKTSLFISGASKETLDQGSPNAILDAPEIYNLPDATNSAQLELSGVGTLETTLHIFVNGEETDTFQMSSEDFSASVSLQAGENEIYAQTEDVKNKKVKDSPLYKVLYINSKPNLTIGTPTDGQTIASQEVEVTGKTDQNVSIRIDNAPTVVASDGSFRQSVRLKEGENMITVEAFDIAGNSNKVELRITYQKED